MRLFRYAPPAVLAVGLAVGCGQPTAGTLQSSSAPTSTASTTPTLAPAPTPAPAESKVELKEISAAGFEEVIRELKGKVVLVDAWFLG